MLGLEISQIDYTAEEAIIAEILTDPESAWDLQEILTPQDFSVKQNRVLYSTVMNLLRQGQTPDILTVTDALERDKNLKISADQAIEALSRIVQRGHAGSATSYAEVIKDRSTLRRIHSVAGQLEKIVDTPGITGEAAISQAEALVLGATEDPRRDAESCISLAEAAAELLEEMRHATPSELAGITTGFAALDKATLGWKPGELVVVGATPGSGKSAFLLQTAMVLAEKTGKPIVMLSHEMTRKELTQRCLAALLKKPLTSLLTGRLTREDEEAVLAAIEVADHLNIIINDDPPLDYMGLESWLRRTQRKTPLGGVVLDYLQMMKCDDRTNRAKFLGDVCYLMKRSAKSGKYTSFVASQLNRNISMRQDPTPRMSDLRESGDIEASANTILLLHRDYNNPNADPTEAKVFIGKQRAGETGIHAQLKWNGPTLTFHNDSRFLMPKKNQASQPALPPKPGGSPY